MKSRAALECAFLTWLPCLVHAYLPYIPTTALLGKDDAVYIFQPSSDSSSASLATVDLSSRISTSSFSPTIISQTLPFLSNDSTATLNRAFTPIQDHQGNIYVLAGKCADGAHGSYIWTYTGGGEWTEDIYTLGSTLDGTGPNIGGINYLAAGFGFTGNTDNAPTIYSFGGMCPNISLASLTASTWQASANYSSAMTALTPVAGSSNQSMTNRYTLSLLSNNRPPVAEAGFTAVSLQPSRSESNNKTIQQDIVLVGGHTQQAFINMSQVALFSLPEQTWTFLGIDDPSSSTTVDPRSGHTAVLSEDGTSIVIFGGWVGDINTPANPQLAVLELGAGYGGNGNWKWSIPSTPSGPGLSTGQGIYGHGAVMLPGGVMMVVAGNTISGPSRTVKRIGSGSALFYNVTTNAFLDSYQNPSMQSPESGTSGTGSLSSNNERKIGLAVGLTLGIILLIIVAILLATFLSRRRRRRNASRNQDLLRGSINDTHPPAVVTVDGSRPPSMAERPRSSTRGFHPWGQTVDSGGEPTSESIASNNGQGWRDMRTTEVERTGLLVEIPNPNRGLKRSLHSRGGSYYEEGRRSRASGHIHVIEEGDEYEGTTANGTNDNSVAGPSSSKRSSRMNVLDGAPVLDPFMDPLGSHPVSAGAGSAPVIGGSRTPSPQSPEEEREREFQGWVSDWTKTHERMQEITAGRASVEERRAHAPEAATVRPVTIIGASGRRSPTHDQLQPKASQRAQIKGGRSSPDKSDRTSSTLSEKSMHSAVSFLSSTGSLARAASQRSTQLFSIKPRSPKRNSFPMEEVMEGQTSGAEPIAGGSRTMSPGRRSKSLTLDGASGLASRRNGHKHTPSVESTTDPGTTASPSSGLGFQALQAESQALLSGGSHSAIAHPVRRASPSQPRSGIASGLFGSVRRVFGGRGFPGEESDRPSSFSVIPPTWASGQRSPALTGENREVRVRRAVSAGPVPWRARQGARDWGEGEGEAGNDGRLRVPGSSMGHERRSSALTGTSGVTSGATSGEGEEWDVESAVERRCVQVMFTVPRERLRVVNWGDGEEGRDEDEDGDRARERDRGIGPSSMTYYEGDGGESSGADTRPTTRESEVEQHEVRQIGTAL